MASPDKAFPLHNKKIADSIIDFSKRAQQFVYANFSIRDTLEFIDREYMRENDFTEEHRKAQLAVRAGDKRRRTNITVPIVMPQVEIALSYLHEIFLTGYPIFGVGSAPEFDDAALQMETIIEENSITCGWGRELLMFFRDGLKYNLQAVEVAWEQCTVPGFETDKQLPNKTAKPKDVIYSGNVIRRMDLYNTFFDPRVPPAKIHTDGDFAGYTKLVSRIQLKRLINNLFEKVPANVAVRAFESGGDLHPSTTGSENIGYYQPTINPYSMIAPSELGTFDWMAWATDTAKAKIQYKNAYELTKIYARIIPCDFDLYVPEENTPQIWKFLIVNNQVLLQAERCTNVHDYLPIIFGQPIEDGLDYQTKSFASNVLPFQDLASAAMNANIASKRRLVMDRGLYDPSRIREADINSDNPSAKIPVRPSAYGKPVGDAYHQLPYRDELSASVSAEAAMYINYANLTNGQNPAQQGQFQKGNKTRHEYADVMGHSNARNRMMASGTELQVMVPVKHIIKCNILQYQQEGTIYNRERQTNVVIDPLTLRKAVTEFKLSDGVLPSEKMLNTEEFQVAVQMLGSAPNIAAGYNMNDVISHLFKQRGVDLRPFEKPPAQIQYEQQMAAWQQAAMAAAQQGTQFSTPLPTPPDPATIEQQVAEMRKRRGLSLQELMTAINKQVSARGGNGATPPSGGNGATPPAAAAPAVGGY